MRIAFSKPHRDEAELEALITGYRDAGYEGLQLKMGQFMPYLRDADGFRARWGDDRGTVSGLIFFDELTDSGMERLQATVDFAGSVGAERIIFCHNHARDGVTPEVLRSFARTLGEYAARSAETGVRFSLHHHYGQPVMLPDDVEVFFGATDGRIGLTVDTAHLAKSGIEDIPGFLARFAEIVDNIHLKDYKDGEWRLLGEGSLDLPAILDQLRAQGFDEWLCVDEESEATLQSGLSRSRSWLDAHLSTPTCTHFSSVTKEN
jgi:inosose dehydratase